MDTCAYLCKLCLLLILKVPQTDEENSSTNRVKGDSSKKKVVQPILLKFPWVFPIKYNFISNSRSVKGYWGISVFTLFSHHLNLSPMDNCGKGIWQMWGNCWSLQLLIWIISTLYLSFHIARIRYAATSSFSVTNATSTGNRARLFLYTFVSTPSSPGHFFTSVFVTCKNPSSAA